MDSSYSIKFILLPCKPPAVNSLPGAIISGLKAG